MLTVTNSKVDWVNMPLAECARGNALDSYFTLKVFDKLYQEMEELEMVETYEHLMVPAMNIFKDIEVRGLEISTDTLNELGQGLKQKIGETQTKLKDQIGSDVNFKSNDDIAKVLFSLEHVGADWNRVDDFGFGLYPPIKTAKKNSPSTSAEALELLLDQIETEIERRGLDGQA